MQPAPSASTNCPSGPAFSMPLGLRSDPLMTRDSRATPHTNVLVLEPNITFCKVLMERAAGKAVQSKHTACSQADACCIHDLQEPGSSARGKLSVVRARHTWLGLLGAQHHLGSYVAAAPSGAVRVCTVRNSAFAGGLLCTCDDV